jgi:DNA-binding GntR family transcriptional regulator
VHRALYSASHNDVVVRMLDDLWDKSDRYRRVGLQLPPGGEDRTRDFEEHHELVRLVVARETRAAADLMASHIDHSLAAAVLAAEGGDSAPQG